MTQVPTIKKSYAQRWRRRFSPRSRGNAASVPATEFLPTPCFGSLSPEEQLALEGVVAAHRSLNRGAPGDPLDVDRLS